MNLPTLILASASPRRREWLGRLGLEFRVVPAAVEELRSRHLTMVEMARVNA